MTQLRDWHEFPQWHPQDLAKVFPRLCPAGIDLMAKMFEYDPARRITVGARWALAAALLASAPVAGCVGGGLHWCSKPGKVVCKDCRGCCICILLVKSSLFHTCAHLLRCASRTFLPTAHFRASPAPDLKAKEAMQHSYFDDLDKETVDALENEALRDRE